MDTKNITVIDMDINMKDYPEHEELIEILTEMQDCYQLLTYATSDDEMEVIPSGGK